MAEHKSTNQPDSQGASIARGTFLKKAGLATAGAAVATTAGAGLAGAVTKNAAHFNIVGRAQTVVTFMGGSDAASLKPFQQSIKTFEALNPKIKVNMIAIPNSSWANLFETIITRIAAGNAPDTLLIAIEGVALFGSKNLALPLNQFMKNDAAFVEELRSDTTPEMWNALAYKGKQLCMPRTWNNMMMWYNTKLYQQIGMGRPKDTWTGDDFLAASAKLKKMGIWGTNMWSGLFGLECWSLAAGANLLSADWTKSTATDPGNLTAWQFMYDLVNKYKYAPHPGKIPETAFFESGRLATSLAGRWPLESYKMDKACTSASCPMDIQFFPVLGNGPRKVIFGIDGYTITRTAKDPEATWQLARFLSSKPEVYKLMVTGTSIPCRKSLAYDKLMNPPIHYRAFYDSVLNGIVPVTSPPQYNEVDTATTKWWTAMFANQVTPKQALANLHKDLTAILAKPA